MQGEKEARGRSNLLVPVFKFQFKNLTYTLQHIRELALQVSYIETFEFNKILSFVYYRGIHTEICFRNPCER